MPVVRDTFSITGRGTVVVLSGGATALPVGKQLVAQIRGPDGSVVTAVAFKEWLLRRNPNPIEDEAFLLIGVDKGDVPEGATVEISEDESALAGDSHGKA